LRWSFIGPSETVELNARGRLDATSCRYRGIYERLFTSMQRRVDWAGSVFGTVERQRPARDRRRTGGQSACAGWPRKSGGPGMRLW
jgi:hypothetical protein